MTASLGLPPSHASPLPHQPPHRRNTAGEHQRERQDTEGRQKDAGKTKDNHHTHRLLFTPPPFLSSSPFPSCRPSTRHALPSPYPPHHRWPIGGRTSKRKIKHIKPTETHLKSRDTITVHIHMQHTNLPLQLHPAPTPSPIR